MLNEFLVYKNNTEKTVTFIGDEMKIKISKRFSTYGMLSVAESVHTVGIFEYQINGQKSHGFFLPALIEICPSEIEEITEGAKEYVVLTLKKGDVFMKTRMVVKNAQIAYIVFTEFVEKGYCPSFINYTEKAFLFDTVKRITGSSIPAEHAVFEIIFAHLNRDARNVQIPYRLTDMKELPRQLALRDVAHATTSVTAKLAGGYLNSALTVASVNHNENQSPIEELLRS